MKTTLILLLVVATCMHVSAQSIPKRCTQNSDCATNNGESCDPQMKMCIKRCTLNSDCSKGESCDTQMKMCIQQSQTSGLATYSKFIYLCRSLIILFSCSIIQQQQLKL